jgi:hypothetical protein
MWPTPEGALGIGFVGDHIMAARAAQAESNWQITHLVSERLSFVPFRSAPCAADSAELTQALQRIATAIPQGHWPLQIALPDPAGVFEVLAFDALPATVRERTALAHFRLEKDWPSVAHMHCTTQALGKSAEKYLLLALAFDQAWLDLLQRACRLAGFFPGVVDLNANFVFNHLHHRLAQSQHDGVLITLGADYWTVLVYDNEPRPRFFRTRWRDASSRPDADHGVIVMEVERLVRAYVLAGSDRKIQDIYVYADASERAGFAAQLDARLSTPCQQLDITQGFIPSAEIPVSTLVPGILASTVPRT